MAVGKVELHTLVAVGVYKGHRRLTGNGSREVGEKDRPSGKWKGVPGPAPVDRPGAGCRPAVAKSVTLGAR